MPQVDVHIVVRDQHLDERLNGRLMADSPESLRGEEADPRRLVSQPLHEPRRGLGISNIAKQLRSLSGDLRIRIVQEGEESRSERGVFAPELPDPPETVDPGELVLSLLGGARQCVRGAAVREGELCLRPHAHVLVPEQADEVRLAPLAEVGADELPSLLT
jgi:hypothetical protein